MIKPILRDFPDHFETDRLLIRSPHPGDGAQLYAAISASHAELEQWMPWAVGATDRTAEHSEALVRQAHAQFLKREDLMMLLIHKADHKIIGGSGLHRIDWAVPKFEIGYWLHTGYTGQGYMTEAVIGLREFAVGTLGARRVEIRCDELNSASVGVAQRADFELEARLVNEARHHLTNALRTTLIFGYVPQEREG